MNGIFTQDNVRNTITIISHLGEERREKQVLNFFVPFLNYLKHNYIIFTVQFLKSVAISPRAKVKLPHLIRNF